MCRRAAVAVTPQQSAGSARCGRELCSRHARRAGQARLGGEPDRRVDGAEAAIALALDDLEEEAAVEGLGVGLQELGVALAVVEDVVRLELLDPLDRQVGLGLEVVVVVLGDRQQR